MSNAKIERVTVYSITEHGVMPNEDGMETLADIIVSLWPQYKSAETLFAGGAELNDPANLASLLEAGPDTDIVFLVLPERFVPCKNGPGPDGTAMTVGVLKQGITMDPGATSWKILSDAVRQHEKTED